MSELSSEFDFDTQEISVNQFALECLNAVEKATQDAHSRQALQVLSLIRAKMEYFMPVRAVHGEESATAREEVFLPTSAMS